MTNGDEEIEEERRLCYVGITRAREHLYITCTSSRMMHGTTQCNPVSRFVREIPETLLEKEEIPSFQISKADSNGGKNAFFSNKPYQIPNKPVMPNTSNVILDYVVGDLVKHKQFGIGQVMSIEPGGKDYQVTVNFPSAGIKKLFASLAGLKKS
jgi:DNA helicase-2/ATP-dependent DNA helicase PcrA